MTNTLSDNHKNIELREHEHADERATLHTTSAPANSTSSDQRLRVINQFAKDLIRLSSRQDLIWHTVNDVVGRLGFTDCVIYLIDEKRDILVQSAAYGPKSDNNRKIKKAIEIPIGKGISGHVAKIGEPLLVNDTESDNRYIPDLSLMFSEICVPIIDKGRLLGVLDCENQSKNYFTQEHLELLTTISSMLASRLAQSHVVEQLENTQIELAESEEKYRLLFEKSEDPMMLLTENKFELCNDAAARVFKYANRQEMQNIHPSDASPPMQPDGQTSFEKAEQMMQIAVSQGVHRFEWMHRKKTGEDFPMEVTLTKVPYKGQPAIYAVCRDITERKKMDIALHHAVAKANDANQSKIKFLANMSHELRTPLNAILGFAEMMTEKVFGPLGSDKYEDYAENIHKSANYLSNMINDILDLSVINSSKNKMNKCDGNIDEIVTDCFAMMGQLASDKGVNCIHDIQHDLEPVFADVQELKQILINLIANAVKFTPAEGSVCLCVHAEQNHHVFKVTDTGCGIPEARLNTITDRFDRGQLDPFQAVEGTGLGLAIVKSLVEIHQGTLKIKSVVGKGTSVTFTIPFKNHLPSDNTAQIEFDL